MSKEAAFASLLLDENPPEWLVDIGPMHRRKKINQLLKQVQEVSDWEWIPDPQTFQNPWKEAICNLQSHCVLLTFLQTADPQSQGDANAPPPQTGDTALSLSLLMSRATCVIPFLDVHLISLG